ncbi:hypothetical protein TNCV_4902041 [Trichonephila clavipes]|nr:hypothetical protein TNCV_4902041 [Trichonephila clavipes]
MSKGTSFRLNVSNNNNTVKKQAIKDIDNFITKSAINFGLPIEAFDEYKYNILKDLMNFSYHSQYETTFNPPTGQYGFFCPTRQASKTDHTEFFSDGHGYELVSSVRALVPQKFSVEEELMHVKHVKVKSPHVGVMSKFGRGVISSGIVLVT